MGFQGKPSQACELCRSRRTRCDQQRPTCGQCRRKKVVCTYRDLVDLAFRNENEAVVRRVRQGRRDAAEILPFESPYTTNRNNSDSELVRFFQLSHASGSNEDIALAFFMSTCPWTTYYDYVPELYSRADCSASLKASLEALGLAFLSLARSESTLMEHARKRHLVAVKEVQQALNSPTITKRADTLAAIMLLAFFAGLTFEPGAASDNWTKHIRGALAVLNARNEAGTEDDPVLNVLSSHVTSSVLVDCQQNNLPPPKDASEGSDSRTPASFQEKSEFVLEMLVELRLKDVLAETAVEIFDDLDRLDHELEELLETLPRKHPYHIDPDVVEGKGRPAQHVYLGHRSARIWNIIRITKLNACKLRNEKARELANLGPAICEQLGFDVANQLQYSAASAASTALDICASVPAFMRDPTSAEHLKGVNWAFSLLWPLSMARASEHLPSELQSFVDRQLQILWNVTNFGIVDYHSGGLFANLEPQKWTHVYFMC